MSVADAEARRDVVLTGWVHRRRDLGQLIFVELRDATGRVQIVFDPDNRELHAIGEKLHAEDVVGVRGTVVIRESPNPQHPTGLVELRVDNPSVGATVKLSMVQDGRVLTESYKQLDKPLEPGWGFAAGVGVEDYATGKVYEDY